jgi:hypothetical protein
MKDFDQLAASIIEITRQVGDLDQRAVQAYAPIVERLLRSGSRDIQQIEQALDGLLGFCGNASALDLFQRLCRYYYDFDSAAATFYVHAYRKMWDSEFQSEEED